MSNKKLVAKEELESVYKNHSLNGTSNILGISTFIIKKLLVEYNIPEHSRAESIRLGCIEKYGVDNVWKLDLTINKSKSTKQELYGSANYNNPEKRKTTCLDKYGSPSASGNLDIKEKVKKSFIEKYGVDNIFKDVEYMNEKYEAKYGSLQAFYSYRLSRCQESLENSYGVSNYSKLKDWRDKVQKTTLEHYGVNWPCQSKPCKEAYSQKSKANENFKNYVSSKFSVILDNEIAIDSYSYDFKFKNTLIELDPWITHNSTFSIWDKQGKPKDYHFNKSGCARNNNFRCVHIWDWDNADKILESILLPKQKIYARNCIIKIVNKKEATDFLRRFHFQNEVRSSIQIGLYYRDTLVQLMTFGKPRYNKNYQYELLRLCTHNEFYIIGGSLKLFKFFKDEYDPVSIISYCDLSKFNGYVYNQLGFTLDSVSISKHWYNPETNLHITDNLLRQRGFDQLFGTDYGKGSSNEELMLANGFVEIYDAGQQTFTLNFK